MVKTITCKVEANDSSKFQAPEELRQACSIPKDSFVPNAEVPKMIIISQGTVLKSKNLQQYYFRKGQGKTDFKMSQRKRRYVLVQYKVSVSKLQVKTANNYAESSNKEIITQVNVKW